MKFVRHITKPLSQALIVALITLSLNIAESSAGLVSTPEALAFTQANQARDEVQVFLHRDDVKRQLLALGAAPDQIQSRVDSLTDQEVTDLARHIEQAPAGGNDALGVLVFLFLVLLITDILGFTDVFTFVKKPVRGKR